MSGAGFWQSKPPPGTALDRAHQLAQGLVSLWLFNEGSGSSVNEVANNNRGAITAATWAPAGPHSPALDFGTGRYVEMVDSSSLSGTQRETFAAWLFMRTAPGAGQSYISQLLSDEDASSGSAIYRIGSQGSSTFARRLGVNFNDGGDHDAESATDLPLNEWCHVAVTTDGQNARFYVNGWLDNTVSYTITPSAKAGAWRIGLMLEGSRPFDGLIAWMGRWSRPLSQPEMSLLVSDTYGMFAPPVWRRYFVPAAAPPPPTTRRTLPLLGVA